MKNSVFLLVILLLSFSCTQGEKSRTAVAWNPGAMKHTLDGQPETARRIEVIVQELKTQKLWDSVSIIEARPATDTELSLAHQKSYIDYVKNWTGNEKETYLYHDKWSPYNSKYAFQSAATAAGGLIELTEAVANKKFQNGFAIIRPPGHHALPGKGMGYCIFNNISIAALNLLNKKLAQKILIVDMDAHHGNGIEEILKNRTDVMYLSFHQEWMFPYTGKDNLSNVKNYGLHFMYPEEKYRALFEVEVNKAISEFKPDYIIVSAGYDAHWRDYMSNLKLDLSTQAWISQKLVALADQYTEGKIVFSLEGGYDLEALSNGVANTIKALMKRSDFVDPVGKAPAE